LETEPPLPATYAFSFFVIALASPWSIAFSVVLLVLLLLFSALISGSEVAFFSMSPQDVHDLRLDKSPASKRIVYLHSISRKLLATILISNNFVNIAIIMVSNYISINMVPQSTFAKWAHGMDNWFFASAISVQTRADAISFIITTFLVTFLLVLFGEVAPKIYAKINNIRFARLMSVPLVVLVKVFSPFSTLLVRWGSGLEKRFKSTTTGSSQADKDEIDKAIDLTVSQGTQSEAESKLEADLLKSIIKFNDVSVKQIMRARVDVVAVDEQMPFDVLLEFITSAGYSRIPVFREDFDNIVGILYIKDLIQYRHEGPEFAWQELIRPYILYVPESKKINDLLKEFQLEKVHIGIVVDEYGGSAGIVTLEDVMEEVIGEIRDEFDVARDGDYKKIDKNTYVFDGKMMINDVCRIVDIDSGSLDHVRGDADSLAGLILEVSGEMPKKGEEFQIEDMHIIILSVSPRRIAKLRVKITHDAV
jgi:magnesium and cobalt exporter, CNNM family